MWYLNFIINQSGVPAFKAGLFAQRPAPGYVGRLYISTDTFEIFRDTGTGWDEIGGPGTGTITGTLAANRVVYATGTNTVATSNDFRFDPLTGIYVEKDISIRGVRVGTGGGSNNTNAVLGANALQSNTAIGEYSVAVGRQALLAHTQTSYNVAVGARAMEAETSGNINVAIGALSMFNSNGAAYNSTLGYASLYGNTTGLYNVAIGYDSMYSSTTGTNNVAVGSRSLQNSGSGTNNVAVGDGAGSGTANGNFNSSPIQCVYVGASSKSVSGNGGRTNEIVIGFNANGNGSNTVTIGNSSIVANYFTGQVRANTFLANKTASGIAVDITDSANGNAVNINKTGSGFAINVAAGISNFQTINGTFANFSDNVSVASGAYFSLSSAAPDFTKIYRSTGMVFETNTFLTKFADTGNFIIGTTTDNLTNKLQVNGSGSFTSGVLVPNGVYYQSKRNSDSATINLIGFESGTDNVVQVTSGTWKLRNTGVGDGANLLTVSNLGVMNVTASIQTAAPSTGTAQPWKLGAAVAPGGTLLLNNTYVEVEINGVFVKLATVL